MARLLTEVLDKVLALIPESEVDLRDELSKAQRSAQYGAPEAQYLYWERAQAALHTYTPDPPPDWAVDVIRLWNSAD